jgi:hypothetical protein
MPTTRTRKASSQRAQRGKPDAASENVPSQRPRRDKLDAASENVPSRRPRRDKLDPAPLQVPSFHQKKQSAKKSANESAQAEKASKENKSKGASRTRPSYSRMKRVVIRMLGVNDTVRDAAGGRKDDFRLPKDAADYLADIFVAMFTTIGQKHIFSSNAENAPIRRANKSAAEHVLVTLILAAANGEPKETESDNEKPKNPMSKADARKIPAQLLMAGRLTEALAQQETDKVKNTYLSKIGKKMSELNKPEAKELKEQMKAMKLSITGLLTDPVTKPGTSIKDVSEKIKLEKKDVRWVSDVNKNWGIDVDKSYVEQTYVTGEAFKSAFAAFKKLSQPSRDAWEPAIAGIVGNMFHPSVAYELWRAQQPENSTRKKTESIKTMLTTTLAGNEPDFFGALDKTRWSNSEANCEANKLHCMPFPGKTLARTIMLQGAGGEAKPPEKAMRMAMFAFNEVLARVLKSAKTFLDPNRPQTYSLAVLRQAVHSADARPLNAMLRRLSLSPSLRYDVTQSVALDKLDKEDKKPVRMSKAAQSTSESSTKKLALLRNILLEIKAGKYKNKSVEEMYKKELNDDGMEQLLQTVLVLSNAKRQAENVYVTTGANAGEREKNEKHKKHSKLLNNSVLLALTSTDPNQSTKMGEALAEVKEKLQDRFKKADTRQDRFKKANTRQDRFKKAGTRQAPADDEEDE